MKRFILLTLFTSLSSLSILACGFYPYGEDVRYNLLKPEMVMPNQVNWFHYCAYKFYYDDYDFQVDSKEQYAENTALWNVYFGNQYNEADIYEALIHATSADMRNKNCGNSFIEGLHKNGKTAEINYFIFAKSCSGFNTMGSDPWERVPKSFQRKRAKMIKKALQFAEDATQPELKKRYAYLALRMAYYHGDEKKVQTIYDNYFSKLKYENALDYWALHFYTLTETESQQRSIHAALVFLNSTEKRFAIHESFNTEYALEDLLAKAKTNDEKIALHFISASLSYAKALDHIEAIAAIDPNHPCLNFLVLREINKLEDWILTPTYTEFSPSTQNIWEEVEQQVISDRVAEDRDYAAKLATVIRTISTKRLTAETWLDVYAVYATFLARDFEGFETKLEAVGDKVGSNQAQIHLLNQLWILYRIASDRSIFHMSKEDQTFLMEAHKANENQFLLAVARELEMKKQYVDAACIFSHVNEGTNSDFWKSKQHHTTLGSDYYYEYFYYLDATYDIRSLKLIQQALTTRQTTDDFTQWCYVNLRKDEMRFMDLIGTKYFRQNQLNEALNYFEQVNDTLWNSDYTSFNEYLNKDPFSNDFYGRYTESHQKEIENTYTKPELVKEMLRCLEKINQTTGNEKAKYAYRLGNCYRNMTYYGNAWMMRRYFWSGYARLSGLEDDEEYYHANMAQKYYLMASEAATNSKFSALALTMAAKCEQYGLLFDIDANWRSDDEEVAAFKLNKYYKRLMKEYPDDYNQLVHSCDYMPDYFSSIN